MDARIAATTAMYGATLVHKDPHFEAIPRALVSMEKLETV